jgi:lipopolysaccharide biosynthesis regulator YciM
MEAADALRLAVRTAPEHVDARCQLGIVLLKRGKGADGLRVLDTGLARPNLTNEQRCMLLQQASSCAAATNNYDLARSYLEQALFLGGEPDPNTLNQVAAICCKGGEFGTGFDYFLKSAQISRKRTP